MTLKLYKDGHRNIVLSEPGTRDTCCDNLALFSGHKSVACAVCSVHYSLHGVETSFLLREANIFYMKHFIVIFKIL